MGLQRLWESQGARQWRRGVPGERHRPGHCDAGAALRRFDELSLPQFAGWGAIGGLLLSLLPSTVFALESGNGAQAAAVVGTVTLLSAASAAGSLMLARVGEDRELLAAGDEVAEVGLTGEEAKALLGGAGRGVADS